MRVALLAAVQEWASQGAFAFCVALESADQAAASNQQLQQQRISEGGSALGVGPATSAVAVTGGGYGGGGGGKWWVRGLAVCWDHRCVVSIELPDDLLPPSGGQAGHAPAGAPAADAAPHVRSRCVAGSSTGAAAASASVAAPFALPGGGHSQKGAAASAAWAAESYRQSVCRVLGATLAAHDVAKWCFASGPQLSALCRRGLAVCPGSVRDAQVGRGCTCHNARGVRREQGIF